MAIVPQSKSDAPANLLNGIHYSSLPGVVPLSPSGELPGFEQWRCVVPTLH